MRSSTFGDVTLKRMLSRTYAKPVGTLTVKLLGEQKMTDEKVTVFEIVKIGAVGATLDNRIYWSATQDPRMPVFGEKPDYFVEVDFHD
jgi:hypothetical protein